MNEDIDWSATLRQCMESTYYCVLSTHGSAGPWANPVYFSYDAVDWSLLFISLPETRHMHNIDDDSRVSVAVFNTEQPPGEHVLGIQLGGVARKLTGSDVINACEQYFARHGAKLAIDEEHPDPADYQGQSAEHWQFVRIVPTELWLFDSRRFGEQRVAVPDRIWRRDGMMSG